MRDNGLIGSTKHGFDGIVITIDDIKSGRIEKALQDLDLNKSDTYFSKDDEQLDAIFTKDAFKYLKDYSRVILFSILIGESQYKCEIDVFHKNKIYYYDSLGNTKDISIDEDVTIVSTISLCELKSAILWSKACERYMEQHTKKCEVEKIENKLDKMDNF